LVDNFHQHLEILIAVLDSLDQQVLSQELIQVEILAVFSGFLVAVEAVLVNINQHLKQI
jgi:hypothetical protein|tara:strand:+ start:595 stop:771 length:177 start_codon:yes stop_codon:yes gene_type:complete